ncbi:pectate lyase [Labilibaculum euxinus]
MKNIYLISMIMVLTITSVSAKNKQTTTQDYLSLKWKQVSTKMPAEWYGTEDAKLVAENVMLSQKEIGGWEKNKPYHHAFSESEKAHYIQTKSEIGATFDNGATISELRFLAKVYSHFHDERYKQAFEKGLDYIFISQYENGGWPQFYPYKGDYADHITYNDDAMVNTMKFLFQILDDSKEFSSLQINKNRKDKAQKAFDKGIQCILKTQIVVNGQPTVWCAQHDEKTFAPANARAYELASFSGGESVNIALLLMKIDKPSKEIIVAVNGAVKWFEANKIEGVKLTQETDKNGKKNRIIVKDKNASPLWARFYDLETGKPYFCSRDGIKRNSLAEISYERRNGYGWYTNTPEKLLKKYPGWRKKVNAK